MAPTPSVRMVKSFPYRGGTQVWSNRYHFNGGTPLDLSHWTTLINNIAQAERPFLPPTVTITEGIAYGAGSELPLFTVAVNLVGSFATAGAVEAPGDCAAVLRFNTTARSTKNHPIYLFNYFHGAFRDGTGTNDALAATQLAAINTFGTQWLTGFSDGTATYVRAGPNGATATARATKPEIRHRDFPD